MALFDTENEDYWIPLADIMTGLMLIFLLIAASYIIIYNKEIQTLKEHYTESSQLLMMNLTLSQQIRNELIQEFNTDTLKWQATIESQDISISFDAPEVLFATGSADLKTEFKEILQEFLPRYLQLLQEHSNDITEIRINGFSSNFWGKMHDPEQIYLLNMQLSQQRAVNVLNYLHQITPADKDKEYLRNYFTANGFSSSHALVQTGREADPAKTQRVEFRVILKGQL